MTFLIVSGGMIVAALLVTLGYVIGSRLQRTVAEVAASYLIERDMLHDSLRESQAARDTLAARAQTMISTMELQHREQSVLIAINIFRRKSRSVAVCMHGRATTGSIKASFQKQRSPYKIIRTFESTSLHTRQGDAHMQRRRSVRHWIAGKLGIQAHIDEEERHSLIETGIRLGVALVTKKPVHESYRGYGQMVAEQATGAHVQFFAPPPSAVYEQPQKETGPTRPVNPEQLKRLIGTTTLPAIPGELARKYREQQRRAGK